MFLVFNFKILSYFNCSYIVGSKTAYYLGDWRWALRVTPALGLIAIILIFFLREPERGQHEGHQTRTTSYKEDLVGKYFTYSINCISTISVFDLSKKNYILQIFGRIRHSCYQH